MRRTAKNISVEVARSDRVLAASGETSIKVVSNFANANPDMKFDVKEVLVAATV